MLKVWLLYLLEAVGLPLPAEIPILLSGVFITTGRFPAWAVIGSAYCVSTLGNIAGYSLGRFGGRPILQKLGLANDKVAKLEAWVQKRGLWALVLTRWLNWGFGQSLWVAGLTRVPWRRFLPTILINNLAWAIVWILFGASVLHWLEALGLHRGVVIAGLILISLAVGYLVYRRAEAKS